MPKAEMTIHLADFWNSGGIFHLEMLAEEIERLAAAFADLGNGDAAIGARASLRAIQRRIEYIKGEQDRLLLEIKRSPELSIIDHQTKWEDCDAPQKRYIQENDQS